MITIPVPIYAVIKRIKAKGYKVYLVGGATRSFFLKHQCTDFDLATTAKPQEILRIFPSAIPTGIRHGTVTVPRKPYTIEISTLRIEGMYNDSRHPSSVSFTNNILADLSRRDFTINAIAYDMHTHTFIDPYKGQKDIKKKIIRTVGSPHARFEEDSLRLLRAVRFATQLQFQIESPTKQEIAILSNSIINLSAERIYAELHKILLSKHYYYGMLLLNELNILSILFKNLSNNIILSLQHKNFDPLRVHNSNTRLCSCFFTIRKCPLKISHLSSLLITLRFPKKTIKHTIDLLTALSQDLTSHSEDFEIRNHLAQSDRSIIKDELELRSAFSTSKKTINQIKQAAQHPISLKELAINGTQIMNLGCKGKKIKEVLQYCLSIVLKDPHKNVSDHLVKAAKVYIQHKFK